MTATSTPGIPLSRKLALGAGDFGLNLYWQFASLYLLFYYTDILGVPAALAGAIYMAALIVDAITDPLIGAWAEKTRTRHGRYRPFLIYGSLPVAVLFALNFVKPFDDATASLVFVASAHIGFRGLYGILSIPYATLFARVTRNSRERGDMAGMRMFFATCGAVGVAAGTQPLVKLLGLQGQPGSGWMMAGLLYAACATLLMWLAAWGAHGLDHAEDEPAPKQPLAQTMRLVARNRALMIMLVAVVVSSFTGTLFGKNVLYYFKYVLQREDAIGMALGLGALLSAVSVPVWVLIMRRIDKKATWMAGSFIVVAGFLLWRAVDGQGLPAHLVSVAIQAFGGAGVAVSMWAMLPDTVEYGEWRNGQRIESFAFGLAVFFQKLALGLGAGAVGLALGWIGYRANEAQSPEVLDRLKDLMFWLPLAGKLVAIAVMSRYPMGRGEHERIRRELEARSAT